MVIVELLHRIETEKKAPFVYAGSVVHGTVIYFGSDYAKALVSKTQYRNLRDYFSSHGRETTPAKVDEWIKDNVVAYAEICDYVLAILSYEGYAVVSSQMVIWL